MKKLVLWFGLAFLLYTAITAPTTAAHAVRQTWTGVTSAGQSLSNFFDAVIS